MLLFTISLSFSHCSHCSLSLSRSLIVKVVFWAKIVLNYSGFWSPDGRFFAMAQHLHAAINMTPPPPKVLTPMPQNELLFLSKTSSLYLYTITVALWVMWGCFGSCKWIMFIETGTLSKYPEFIGKGHVMSWCHAGVR